MGKRANGEGSIYRQSPDGRWVAAITMPDGKTKRFYFKTQKEAREKLTEVRRDVQRGLSIPEGRMTVERFLHEWLRTI